MRNRINYWKTEFPVIIFLVITLLIFLNLYLMMQVMPLFRPIQQAVQIIFPPLIASILSFYILNPFVDYLEGHGVSRVMGIVIVFLSLVLLITIGILFIVPIVNEQVTAIVEVVPVYWQEAVTFFEERIGADRVPDILDTIQQTNVLQTATRQAQNIFSAAVGGIGSAISVTTQIVITIFTVPFVLYFMLIDAEKIPERLVRYTPVKFRPTIRQFLSNVHNQLGIYVRGQVFVAICVGIIFLIGYAAIGLDFYLVLALIAGVFNLVPYLGSFISGALAVIVALFQDPILIVYLMVVFAVEQLLENRIIGPLVLGNQLNIHPITILFVLLISGSSFGVAGLLLGVPTYAILKIIVSITFDYIEEHTDLYIEDPTDDAEEAFIKSEE